jgi:hypothetical protein
MHRERQPGGFSGPLNHASNTHPAEGLATLIDEDVYGILRGADLRRASIIRLASATISSVRLFSRLDGLSSNARVEPGEKIDARQPFPTWLTSIRYPL